VSERVVELPSQASRPSPEFERTPPQDIAAEQSVLGGMLLSKDAIADVVEVVRATDFYRPAHQTIFDVVVDLYGRGEPADPITVSAELTRLGEIGRVGGAPYLHTLLSSVPTAANAGFYAKIVAEQAILRRLVEAGTRIVQLGYGAAGDRRGGRRRRPGSAVGLRRHGAAQQRGLHAARGAHAADDGRAGGHRQPGRLDVRRADRLRRPRRAHQRAARRPAHRHRRAVLASARPSRSTPRCPRPTGWTTMGHVAVGDLLLALTGRPTKVVRATPVLRGRPCYEVAFSDGTRVVADAGHQWLTETRASRRSRTGAAQVRTTEELARSVRCPGRDARANHSVRTTAALQLPEAELAHDPYALGVWLAAGRRRSPDDGEIVVRLESRQASRRPIGGSSGQSRTAGGSSRRSSLRSEPARGQLAGPADEAGDGADGAARPLRRSMHQLARRDGGWLPATEATAVPSGYLRAAEPQRRALLAGLMDAAGSVTTTGNLQFSTPYQRLAEDVHELVVGLGHRCTIARRPAPGGGPSGERLTVTWTCDEPVFTVERKHLLHKSRSRGTGSRTARRWITAVTPVPPVPVRCVEVDNADHLYLATRAMLPTHNSTLGLDIARAASVKHAMPSAIFSLEMSKTEITMRLLSAEARVPLHHMRSGTMTDDDWARLARRMGEVAEAPLYIDDSPNLTMMEIRAKARRLRQRNDLQLIVIDYLQLMSGNKKARAVSRRCPSCRARSSCWPRSWRSR
jgi:replicative DNA helicase